MREVELLCDEVLLMKKGKLVEQGSPAELLLRHDRSNLEEVFWKFPRKRNCDFKFQKVDRTR